MRFFTQWMGENHFAEWPVALYYATLLICATAHSILHVSIIRHEGANSVLLFAVGIDVKRKVSLAKHILAAILVLLDLLCWLELFWLRLHKSGSRQIEELNESFKTIADKFALKTPTFTSPW